MKELIWKQDAIDAVNNLTYPSSLVDVKRILVDLPSAQPKGRWIFVHPLQKNDNGAYMCSECKVGNWEIDPERYFFCPNCGANMRGDKDGTD